VSGIGQTTADQKSFTPVCAGIFLQPVTEDLADSRLVGAESCEVFIAACKGSLCLGIDPNRVYHIHHPVLLANLGHLFNIIVTVADDGIAASVGTVFNKG